MLWFLKKFHLVISSAAALIGIYYIPIDTLGIEDASGPWRKLLSMIDQNSALWFFSISCVLYLIWVETRPFFRDFLFGRMELKFKHVSNAISGEQKTSDAVYIVLNNTKQTVRDVSATFTLWRNGQSTSDDHPVRLTKGKFQPVNLNPSDSEGLHFASSKVGSLGSTIHIGAIDESEGVLHASIHQREVVGELRVNWDNGGPISKYVHLVIGENGFMISREITEKEAKALSRKSQPIQYIGVERPH